MTHSAAHGVQHYENFPVASWLTPARLRGAIVAIYWFARVADDLADEGDAPFNQRLADLAAYRADLMACATPGVATGGVSAGASTRWPGVFAPLSQAIAQHHLPLSLLDALLQAFEQDVRYTAAQRWYADDAGLMNYCARSANPVGRLLLHLYGVRSKAALAQSDAICSALQLINFWQDFSRDLPRSRFYAPQDAMAQFNLTQQHLLALNDTPDTMKLIAYFVGSATDTMLKGFELPALVQQTMGGWDGWRLSLELRCVIHGGLRIVDKIKAIDYCTLAARPKLSAWDCIVIVWRALWH